MGQFIGVELGKRRPPTGLNTATVCEMLGWSIGKLFDHVHRGELPPPDWWGQEMVWPFGFVTEVRRRGLSLPGTFGGFLPGTDCFLELSRWARANNGGALRYTARGKRAARKASKKGGRK